jgi:hypothetical protein
MYCLPQKIVHHHTGDRDQGFYQRKVPIVWTVSVSADGRWLGEVMLDVEVVQWGYCPLCTQKPNSESTWTNHLYLVNGKYKENLSCMSLWCTLVTYTSERCERSPGIESKESIPPACVTCVDNLSPAMRARNQVGIGCSTGPPAHVAWLLNSRLGSWNQFLAP